MPDRVPMPERLGETARRFAESGGPPVTPKLAGTVVLLRPGASTGEGFEVFALRRVATMAFAPSMYAFPGGTVDPRDAEVDVGWTGPEPAWWASRFQLDEALARGVVCAAVREVFDECGVLLAGPDESTVVGDVSGVDWEANRLALLAREVALSDLLASRGLVVRSDLLVPWSRWLTPEFEPRRYDTFFFLARLPTEQRTRDVGGESDHMVWGRPGELGQLPMLPPTAHTLRELATYPELDALLALEKGPNDVSKPWMPRAEFDGEQAWLTVD